MQAQLHWYLSIFVSVTFYNTLSMSKLLNFYGKYLALSKSVNFLFVACFPWLIYNCRLSSTNLIFKVTANEDYNV